MFWLMTLRFKKKVVFAMVAVVSILCRAHKTFQKDTKILHQDLFINVN